MKTVTLAAARGVWKKCQWINLTTGVLFRPPGEETATFFSEATSESISHWNGGGLDMKMGFTFKFSQLFCFY
jgi:hypothetical protein